jgi:hypothetical protein
MQLNRTIKILVGLGTAWHTLYPLLFFAFILLSILGMGFTSSGSSEPPPFFIIPFFAIFPLHCLTILLGFGLTTFYLIHILKNTIAAETVRILLGVGLFFLSFIAMPLYYYLFIWREQPPDWAIAPAYKSPPIEIDS